MPASTVPRRLTLTDIRKAHAEAMAIAVLTAYDAVTAALLDETGVDILLVGDSLGNVVLGFDTTVPVTLEDMIRHASAVVRGSRRPFVVCDLPFGTATDPEIALQSSVRVLQETGCQAVKLEGGRRAVASVSRLTQQGIPVMGHIGLLPQSVHQIGGYFRQGRSPESAKELLETAQALEEAGAFAIVLEMVLPDAAAEITRAIGIPTIGIGSGPDCAGQVLVINDLIGLNVQPPPSFARPRADVASAIRTAASEYVRDLKSPHGAGVCPEPSLSTPATRTS